MGTYWWEVFKESVWSSAEAVGYSRQTFIYVVLVFGLTAWRVWLPQGWKAMRENLAKTIGEVFLLGVIAWLPFLIFHVALVSYRRWQGENDRANEVTEEYRKYKEEEAKPHLQPKIIDLMVGPAGNKENAIVGVIGTVKNVGAEGTIDDVWIDVKFSDGRIFKGQIAAAPAVNQNVNFAKNEQGQWMSMPGSKYWMNERSEIIHKYGHLDGFAVALVRGVTKEEILDKHATIVFTCSDVTGAKSSAEFVSGSNSGISPLGLSGLQKPVPHHKD